LYPEMRLLKLAGRSAVDFFSNASTASLAMQLNCLTVPGAALKLDELWPGRLLRTAGFGALKVISNRCVGTAVCWGSSVPCCRAVLGCAQQ
jgi:hypothetical protein